MSKGKPKSRKRGKPSIDKRTLRDLAPSSGRAAKGGEGRGDVGMIKPGNYLAVPRAGG